MRWPWRRGKAQITSIGAGFTEAWVPVGTVLQLQDGKRYVVKKVETPTVLTISPYRPWLPPLMAFAIGLLVGYLLQLLMTRMT